MFGMDAEQTPLKEHLSGLLAGFGRGTRLMTQDGPVPVEEIETGEAVLDCDGRPHFVLWQGSVDLCPVPGWVADPWRAVVIAANAFGPGKPRRDLRLSQQHRVMVDTVAGLALVPARALAPHLATVDTREGRISYHVVVTRSPCLLMAENLPCESFVPGAMRDTKSGNAPPFWPVAVPCDPVAGLRL